MASSNDKGKKGNPVQTQPGQEPPPPPYAPNQTVVMHGGFDAGARFDNISQPNIPVR